MKSGNPVLNDNSFGGRGAYGEPTMSLAGTAFKTYVLLAFLMVGFVFTWSESTKNYTSEFSEAMKQPAQYDEDGDRLPTQISISPDAIGYAVFGSIGGFLLALVIIFNPKSAPFLSPVYATLEGLTLGAVSAGFEAKYPGIAMQAAGATFGTLFGMLLLYTTGMVKASANLALGLLSAMFGILVVYFLDIILSFFGATYTPVAELVHGNSWASIGFSMFVVGIAAFNLVLDFDFIEKGVQRKSPKYMEWYGAFGLMVTLVWLYLEILRLIAKARSKD